MKKVLKFIFPVLFLKKAFLIFNQVKGKTWDRILFSSYQPTINEIILFRSKNPFIELSIDTANFSDDVNDGFSRWLDPTWMQDEYIVEIQSATYIESSTGWGVCGSNKLIYYSLGFAKADYVKKPSFEQIFLKQRREKHLGKVISLRDTGEENYFHFYNDIIPKLLLLRDHNLLDYEANIVVAKKLWEKNYFQHALKSTWLGQLNWYVQGEEWVKTCHVIFCKPYTHTKHYLSELVSLLRPNPPVGSGRIFLTRPSGSFRYIENENEILEILNHYGFQKLDTTNLDLTQQIEIFSSASDLVSVHGAGITNIIFREGATMRILELFHKNEYLPFHYVMLANIFGYKYNAIRGEKGKKSSDGGFYVDPWKLEAYCKSVYNVTQ
jgi:hypothetical protein